MSFLLFHLCCFIYAILLTSFLVEIKCWISFCHNDVILEVLLINNNHVTQLSWCLTLNTSLKLLSASTAII
jgi:hypothetical protein